jgi:hypothetical protein
VPSGRGAGKPYRLRPTHRRWLREAFDHDAEVIVVSGPRGLGKTGWMAAVAVWAAYDRPGASVILASTAMRTALHSYSRAVRIIETNPRLDEQAMIYRNKADPYVELPIVGSFIRPLPAEERYIVGEAPSLVLIDEVGYVESDTWEALQTSLGKIDDATLIAFGTPGLGVVGSDDRPNVMYAMRELERAGEAPETLRYIEHAARPSDDPANKRTWKRANPLLGDLVSERTVAHDFATMSASRFGQMRLGLWTQHETSWMPAETWDQLPVEPGPLDPGSLISLGFDGSVSRDSTALVAHEPARGRIVVLGHWRLEPGQRSIDRTLVLAAIDAAFTDHNVTRLYADPWHWRRELAELAERYGEERVIEWNTASPARMGPASDAFMASAMSGELTVDGSSELRAHALAAVAKRTAQGDMIARDARRPRDTDLITAAILAHEASRTWIEIPTPRIY